MAETFVSVLASSTIANKLKAYPFPKGIEAGNPVPYDSISDALDSTLSVEFLKEVLDFLDIAFRTSADFLVFAKALVELLKVADNGEAKLLHGERPLREIATVTAKSDPNEIAQKMEKELKK